MEILEYSPCSERDKWIKQIESYEWSAAKFLVSLLRENRLTAELGGWAKLYLLVDGEKLVSFLTLSAQDCISDPALTPWLGFFHTAPEYRGHRYGKTLIDHTCRAAEEMGYQTVYIATDHVNLYEKYGFTYIENRLDVWGADSRVYLKRLGEDKNA